MQIEIVGDVDVVGEAVETQDRAGDAVAFGLLLVRRAGLVAVAEGNRPRRRRYQGVRTAVMGGTQDDRRRRPRREKPPDSHEHFSRWMMRHDVFLHPQRPLTYSRECAF